MEFVAETLVAHVDSKRLKMEISLAELGGMMMAKAVEIGKVEIQNLGLANLNDLTVTDDGLGRGPIVQVVFPIEASNP